MTQQTLSKIESLVYRTKFYNEFLEEKLQESLDPIFKFPGRIPGEFYPELKHLLFQVSGIDKSSAFGYFFYGNMQENPYPFCEDILKSATFTERYYNLHDKALKSYVRSYLINKGVSPEFILKYDKMIPEGHGIHFFGSLNAIQSMQSNPLFHIPADLLEILTYVTDNDNFPMSQKKATCIICFLNIRRLFPVLIGKINALMEQQALDKDKTLVLLHMLKAAKILREKLFDEELSESIDGLIGHATGSSLPGQLEAFKKQHGKTLQEMKNIL